MYIYVCVCIHMWASLEAQMVKNPPAMLESWVQSLGLEDMKYPTYNLNEQCNNTQP